MTSFIADGHLTTYPAAHVFRGLEPLLKSPYELNSLALELDQTIPGDPRTIPRAIMIRLAYGEDSILTLANEQELVRCQTEEGAPVDILFGHISEWDFEPCLVFVSDEAFDTAIDVINDEAN